MNRQELILAGAARYGQVLDAAAALGGWQFIKLRDRWSLYLMASYCYYELDRGLMPDALFDSLCRALLAGGLGADWWFKDLWDASALAAGSGYHTFGRIDPTQQSIALAIRPAELGGVMIGGLAAMALMLAGVSLNSWDAAGLLLVDAIVVAVVLR